jgi:hypothetical protein
MEAFIQVLKISHGSPGAVVRVQLSGSTRFYLIVRHALCAQDSWHTTHSCFFLPPDNWPPEQLQIAQ